MSKLIEKMSYSQRGAELDRLLTEKATKTHNDLMEYMAEQVELAYIAGYNRFNALDHTTIVPLAKSVARTRWVDLQEDFPVTGPDSILPSLYLQSKGFKP